MIKNMVSVMDFGSSKITMLVGVGDVNRSFRLLASADCEYEGFANGEFIDSNNLHEAISSALNCVERELECKVDNIYIGVPAEFCFVHDDILTKTFNKKTKITPKIIDDLFVEDREKNPYPSHTIINKAPLYFVINDENKTNEPVGQFATKIQARTSYILVENKFKLLIGGIMKAIGVKNYDFISNTLAESIYLIDENKRNEGAILVDCGHISTSVSQVLGDGIKELKSFSMGGGFITADLSRILDISYEEAEELKRQAILTLKPSGVDVYETKGGKKFAVKTVNEIILARVDKIVELIVKCVDNFEMELPSYIPIFLTGGGLNYYEGIKDYFRREIGREVKLVAPKALIYSKPDLSSSISLLNMSINLYK